jgi:hypothetical protein
MKYVARSDAGDTSYESSFDLGEAYRRGELQADTPIYHRDLDRWMKLREVPELAAILPIDDNPGGTGSAQQHETPAHHPDEAGPEYTVGRLDGTYHPLSLAALRIWALDGRLSPNDPVYTHRESAWTRADQIPGLGLGNKLKFSGSSSRERSSRADGDGTSPVLIWLAIVVALIVLWAVFSAATSGRSEDKEGAPSAVAPSAAKPTPPADPTVLPAEQQAIPSAGVETNTGFRAAAGPKLVGGRGALLFASRDDVKVCFEYITLETMSTSKILTEGIAKSACEHMAVAVAPTGSGLILRDTFGRPEYVALVEVADGPAKGQKGYVHEAWITPSPKW